MNDFFELARSQGFLTELTRDSLSRSRKTKLLDFAFEASFSLPSFKHAEETPYGFIANTSLSGGPLPCSETLCRLAQADQLARFAALYADHVVIRNPFTAYSPNTPVDGLRNGLEGDLAVMGIFEPLVRKGLVSVTAPGIAMCTDCAKQFAVERERLLEVVDQAGDELFDRFESQITVTREKTGYIGIRGPTELVSHGAQFVLPPGKLRVSGRIGRRQKDELLRWLISQILQEVYLHHVDSRHSRFNYLTDRELELTVIRHLGGRGISKINRAVVQGLTHSVPVVTTADVSDILRLRDAESEAFAVYRNAVSAVLRDADLSSSDRVQEAFLAKIYPELSKIDLAVKNARKVSRRAAVKEIAISSATVSIGLLVGTVQPTIGAVLAAFGGVKALRTVADRVATAFEEPPIVRENSFYFLWKLKQKRLARRSHRI